MYIFFNNKDVPEENRRQRLKKQHLKKLLDLTFDSMLHFLSQMFKRCNNALYLVQTHGKYKPSSQAPDKPVAGHIERVCLGKCSLWLTFGCSSVDGGVWEARAMGPSPMLQEQGHTGHMAQVTGLRQGSGLLHSGWVQLENNTALQL